MKVLTILLTLLFFSGVIFAKEGVELKDIQPEIQKVLNHEINQRKIVVFKGSFRAPAIEHYKTSSLINEVKFWYYK